MGEAVTNSEAIGTARLRLAYAGIAVLALVLAACTASPPAVGPQASLPSPAKPAETTDMSPAALREHQRILTPMAASTTIPELQSMLEQTVERLVAASERPDLHYKVTMLNSQSINAFALPTGRLYVTRGLVALANDESELASVLAHEMGHVVARHATIREEQAKQAALVGRVVSNVISDPEIGALALANRSLRSRASRAPRNSKRTPSASASLRAQATIRMARSGSSPRWSTIRNSSRSRAAPSIRAHRTFCPRIRRRPNVSATRSRMPASIAAPPRPAPSPAGTRLPISGNRRYRVR